MKKKAVLATVLATMLVVCAFALTACGTGVAGNTYVFEEVKVTNYGKDATDDEKTMIDASVVVMKNTLSNSSYKFEEDGSFKYYTGLTSLIPVASGTYEQDGSKLTVKAAGLEAASSDWKVSGKKITITQKDEDTGKTIVMTYKLKED